MKSDNPAQFERVNLCIERCQRLGRTGYGVPAAKTKHQLLKEIQEELKIVSQEEMTRSLSQLPHRPTLSRSHTSVEGGRPQRLSKRRMSTPYISPLTMIGEEDLSLEAGSATLPRHLEQRPKTLQVRGRAMTTGSALPYTGKKTVITSPPPPASSTKKAQFADELEVKPIISQVKRSLSPRRSPRPQHITDGQSSPGIDRARSPAKSPADKSPLLSRGRAPKLGVLGKFGSSGFYADNEDDDDGDGEIVQPSKVTIQLQPGEDTVEKIVVPNRGAVSAGNSPLQVKKQVAVASNGGHISIPNLGAASPGNSPLQVKKQVANSSSNQVTIMAEVYENSDSLEETTRNSFTARVTFSEDGSTTPLLPSPETRRSNKKSPRKVRAISPSLTKEDSLKSKELRVISEDESDGLLEYFRDKSVSESRTNKAANNSNIRKGSLSLDRKNISGLKELNSAFKESSKFMYHSFEEANMDYSQC